MHIFNDTTRLAGKTAGGNSSKIRRILLDATLFAWFVGLSSVTLASTLTVSTEAVVKQSSYDVKRIYGGQLYHRRHSRMGFETSGVIQSVLVDEGDAVKQGQVLVSLDLSLLNAEKLAAKSEVAGSKANAEAAKTRVKLSLATLKRHKNLVQKTHISKQLLDELDQAYRVNQSQLLIAQTQISKAKANLNSVQVRYQKAILKAPFDGTIQTRHIDEGSIISPGAPAITLVESGHLEARIGIPVSMAHVMIPGQQFEFKVNSNMVFGTLRAILPSVNETTATLTALFDLNEADLFAGSLAEMTLSVEVKEDGFWIPLSALAESQRGLWSVLVVIEQGGNKIVEPRLVEVIHQGEDNVYVRGTLIEGDLIINSGTGRVVPGQTVSLSTGEISHQTPLSGI